jgi:ferredoxin
MEGRELWIDRTRCDGHLLCAELLPERIGADDWGYPMIEPGPVPEHLAAHARAAVRLRAVPRRAQVVP